MNMRQGNHATEAPIYPDSGNVQNSAQYLLSGGLLTTIAGLKSAETMTFSTKGWP